MSARGRPPTYRPEMCEEVVELGRSGKSHAQISAALGVSREAVRNWQHKFPEFSEAMQWARDLAQAWWEDKGQDGLVMPGFNASLWAKQVSCRFREDYTEKTQQEITGADGAPLVITWQK